MSAPKMSQTVLSEKPPSPHLIDSDGSAETSPSAVARVTPTSPRAGEGSGSRIRATTTPRKRAKYCQAGAVRPAGCGDAATANHARSGATGLQNDFFIDGLTPRDLTAPRGVAPRRGERAYA